MPALGQKQIWLTPIAMSALPLKVDVKAAAHKELAAKNKKPSGLTP
jgi:hypothetical protein